MMKRKVTHYYRAQKLIVTELSGNLDGNDIEDWESSLRSVLGKLSAGTKFKVLINLHGFKAVNLEAHKKFRVIVPKLLAEYGWYVGYLRMFPEATLMITSTNDIHCLAAAHVHHDKIKIQNYAEKYSMHNEAFFTDPEKAKEWIESIEIN